MRSRRHTSAALVVLVFSLAATAAAQFRFGVRLTKNPPYDGAFQYYRGMYRTHPAGDGGGWTTDYPQADENLPFRLSELTKTSVSRDATGRFNHAIVALADDAIYRCPIVIMQEVGALYLDVEDATHLRDYVLKGGFVWVDDFWGEYAWRIWESQIRKVVPAGSYPIRDLPLDHPMFHMVFRVREVPQIPSINFWRGSGGGTSEQYDSQVPHARAIFDERGRIMVLVHTGRRSGRRRWTPVNFAIVDGEVREHFAIHLYLGLFETVNELTVIETTQPRRRVPARPPRMCIRLVWTPRRASSRRPRSSTVSRKRWWNH